MGQPLDHQIAWRPKDLMGLMTPGLSAKDNHLEWALFGLARQDQFPAWVPMQTDLPILDLGPGAKVVESAEVLDWPMYDFEGYRVRPHIKMAGSMPKYIAKLPHHSNSCGGVSAVHVFEHLFDPRPIMKECLRVLAPGCPLNIVVPDADSQVFKQDIDHKTAFCLDTWKTWIDNGGYYDNNAPSRVRLGANFKFAIKDGNEIIVTQLIKEESL